MIEATMEESKKIQKKKERKESSQNLIISPRRIKKVEEKK